MTKRQKILSTVAATLMLIGGSALAANEDKIGFQEEIDSCIAEINANVNFEDATRVRHIVVEVKNTFAGYVLAIDTDVFTKSADVAAREYASYCVAKGGDKPKTFSIDKISG